MGSHVTCDILCCIEELSHVGSHVTFHVVLLRVKCGSI